MRLATAFCAASMALALFCQAACADDDIRLSTLTVQTASGLQNFFTEVAMSPEAKERGLMFRQKMPEDQAMLFDFNPPQPVQMWMKNTLIPLDMIFVRPDGTIVAIAENTVPQSLDVIGVQEPVAAVIEVAGGVTRKLGIHKGLHVGGPAFPQ
jgi:uncharacterized protein